NLFPRNFSDRTYTIEISQQRSEDMAIEIFTRRELKYLITTERYRELTKRLSTHMRPDIHGTDGHYTVTSIYFESPEHTIYMETKNTLSFHQKLLLRVYAGTV